MSLLRSALTSRFNTTGAEPEVSGKLDKCDKEYLLESEGDIEALDVLERRIQEDATSALASALGFRETSRGAWMKTAEFVALTDAIEEAFVKVRNVAIANKTESARWKWSAATARTSFARESVTRGDVQKVATWVNIEAKHADKRVLYRTYFVKSACPERDGEWKTDLYRDPNELYL